MLNFDSWQRCEMVRHLINWALAEENGLILDVGGYPGRMRTIMPEHTWILCDPRVDAPGDQLRGSAMALPFRDEAFDYCVCMDVLEHLAPEDRTKTLDEMQRVARYGMILSFPHNDPLVKQSEEYVCQVYQTLFEKPHPWLSEHQQNPLPNSERIVEHLQEKGGEVAVFDVGSIRRWVYLQMMDLMLEVVPGGLDIAKEIDEEYPEQWFPYEFNPPTYRKIILHVFHADDPLELDLIHPTAEEETEADIAFYQSITSRLLINLNQAVQPQEAPPEAAPKSSDFEETQEESPEPVLDSTAQEYIKRLEQSLQTWEETCQTIIQQNEEAHRWRDRLEQRKSFRLYRMIMRLLGSRIEP